MRADAAGDDRDNLNDEYVVFRNAGAEPLEMGGGRSAMTPATYTVPDGFTLGPDETVTLPSAAAPSRTPSYGGRAPLEQRRRHSHCDRRRQRDHTETELLMLPDGTYTAVVDRIEDGIATLEVDTEDETVCPR